jgi:hypothetical protein
MTHEEKLEAMVAHYRQKLADEQLLTANLSVNLKEVNEEVSKLQQELDEERAKAQPGKAADKRKSVDASE